MGIHRYVTTRAATMLTLDSSFTHFGHTFGDTLRGAHDGVFSDPFNIHGVLLLWRRNERASPRPEPGSEHNFSVQGRLGVWLLVFASSTSIPSGSSALVSCRLLPIGSFRGSGIIVKR
jgi:hypothetical protein